MRSASSDFYDVSSIAPEDIEIATDTIRSRGWFDKDITIRRTCYGPIVSDASLIPTLPEDTLALKWVGHEPSDDLAAFLRANRARTLEEFTEAFSGYAVSGQNMLAVDAAGNISMTMAVRLPRRKYQTPPDLVLKAGNPDHEWDGFLDATKLPLAIKPDRTGSSPRPTTNPPSTNPPIGCLFSLPERITRLQSVLSSVEKVDMSMLKNLQRDTYSEASHRLRDQWVALIDSLGLSESQPDFVESLRKFTGDYDAGSRGPVAFEMLTYHIADTMFAGRSGQDLYRTWNYICERLPDDLRRLPAHEARNVMDHCVDSRGGRLCVLRFLGARCTGFGPATCWPGYHCSAGSSPITMFPVGGSRETLMKTNHVLTNKRHYTSYGSQARHISSMADLDENYFVLIGGNDGWLGSENLTDLVPLWLNGEYVQLPLRPESVAAGCRFEMILGPGESTILIDRHESGKKPLRRRVSGVKLINEVNLPDGALVYAEYGAPDGDPVIYTHGWPGSRLQARLTDQPASERHLRIIAPDRPGMARSPYRSLREMTDWPTTVANLADHLGFETFSMVGVSAGGAYTLVCAKLLPKRVRRAAICCGVPHHRWLRPESGRSSGMSAARLMTSLPRGLQTLVLACGKAGLAVVPRSLIIGPIIRLLPPADRESLRSRNIGPLVADSIREAFPRTGKGGSRTISGC